ncbi:MAG TPA: CHASE2 domain-containing protein, partial [Verrucomicrobiae bacterium]
MKAFFNRVRWSAWLFALMVAALGWYLLNFDFGSGLVNLSYDLLHILRPKIPAGEAVIVYLDEKSHIDLVQPLNAPWDRALHAQLIDGLTVAGARAIVMDIVFSDANPDKAEADQKLADAMKRSGRVIIGADHVGLSDGIKQYVKPAELFETNAVAYGSVEMWLSRDLIVRGQAPNEQLPSISWEAAKFLAAPVTGQMDAEKFEPSIDLKVPHSWVQYYGPPNWLKSMRYSDALQTAATNSFFSNKVVFIGAKVITKLQNERNDAYRNPYSFWMTQKEDAPLIFGVEIQATMFLNILRSDWLRRWPLATESWIMIVVGALSGYGLLRLRPIIAILVAVAALGAVVFISRELFIRNLTWFPWLIL